MRLHLKPNREKSLRRHHPWVFSGAVAKVEGQPARGATVEIVSAEGEWLARGAYSPQSQIVARVWTFAEAEVVAPNFFQARIANALALRERLNLTHAHTAYRLVNAESDGLPGLVVDRYGDWLVVQFLSAGAEQWREAIVAALTALFPACHIYERSDVDVRAKEGLEQRTGVLAGDAPPDWVEIVEAECRFGVDVQRGHKTGFYLDQRDNRRIAAEDVAGREMLNCFAYTGGFGVWALKHGAAHVTQIDTSAPALEQATRHLALNGLNDQQATAVIGDVFAVLRQYRDSRRSFDVIILDPPKFAESRHQLDGAARGYKDINLLAFKLLRPGGVLITFSCSGLVEPALFQKIVSDAALDANRTARIARRLSQSADHPVSLAFPEGEYLKGLVVVVE